MPDTLSQDRALALPTLTGVGGGEQRLGHGCVPPLGRDSLCALFTLGPTVCLGQDRRHRVGVGLLRDHEWLHTIWRGEFYVNPPLLCFG